MPSLAQIERSAMRARAQLIQSQKTAIAGERDRTPKRKPIDISLADFFRQSWVELEPTTELIWNWHLQVVADHVEVMFRDQQRARSDRDFKQRIKNISINLPPGSSKSRLVSVCTIAWWWLYEPSYRGLYMSGTPSVALRDAIWARDLIESDWYQSTFIPDWQIRSDKRAAHSFWNTAGGMRTAAGLTSKITGARYNCLVMDDLDDAQEVFSEVKRLGVHERWDNAIENRVADPSRPVRIGICQRVHEDDWTGHVVKSGKWDQLIVRQKYDPSYNDSPTGLGWTDPRTEAGELLDPVRFTPEFVEEEESKGSYYFSSQHQQSPAPIAGGMFPRTLWMLYRKQPTFSRTIISIDTSFAKGPTNDYCSILVIGEVWPDLPPTIKPSEIEEIKAKRAREVDRYLIDEWHEKAGIVELEEAILKITKKHPSAATILIEEKANGSAICDRLQTVLPGIERFKPGTTSKEARAMVAQPFHEAGRLFLPANLDACSVMEGLGVFAMAVGEWWDLRAPKSMANDEFIPLMGQWKSVRQHGSTFQEDGFIDEFAKFPAATHDDRVDALSQCIIWGNVNPPIHTYGWGTGKARYGYRR